jgi:tetratricopeptide (TPR) repeat protein
MSDQSLIFQYLKKYQEDPSSRVFAPLAEAYRKAGLVDEAIEIAQEGLRVHPGFFGGRVALARALFDKSDYERVVRELQPVVRDAPDNLAAQRLLGDASLMLGRTNDALDAYKMLLYFSSQDHETAQLVQELEASAYEQGRLKLRTDPDEARRFSVVPAPQAITADPDILRAEWVQRIERLQDALVRVQQYRSRNLNS